MCTFILTAQPTQARQAPVSTPWFVKTKHLPQLVGTRCQNLGHPYQNAASLHVTMHCMSPDAIVAWQGSTLANAVAVAVTIVETNTSAEASILSPVVAPSRVTSASEVAVM